MKLELFRLKDTMKATFGVLFCDETPVCVTLERPWFGNQRDVSCIPRGEYVCTWYRSRKFGRTLLVRDVPYRSGILFHAGNFPDDTQGCILVGRRFENDYIAESKKAMNRFIATVDTAFDKDEEITLTID